MKEGRQGEEVGAERGQELARLYGRSAQAGLDNGRYRIRLQARDAAGNTSARVVVRFAVDD